MNPKLAQWEAKLHKLLRKIDHHLEDRYGDALPLHPSRPGRGTAANPQYDGLFRVTAAFSAGYGSRLGPGYIFQVEIVTLSQVPSEVREKIEREAADMLRAKLPEAFPDRELFVERDGPVFKIHGDLSLDGEPRH
ncbi:MAG: hypothetical protein ACOX9C_00120 [Kiritimatiellia bacterium]|jgi:hypothetical protein